MLPYIIGIVVLLILVFLLLGITMNRSAQASPIERVMKLDEPVESYELLKNQVKHKRWSQKLSSQLFKSKKQSAKLDPYKSLLAQADLEMSPDEFLLLRLLFTGVLSFLAFTIWRTLLMTILAAGVVWMIPRYILKIRIEDKRKRFDAQLLDAIGIISNSLKAGYSFFQALSSVVEETKAPLSKEFRIMLKEMSFGISVDQAFDNLLSRIFTQDLQLLTISVSIQRDIGGNLSEVLENIGQTIRDRQQLKGEIKTLTAQGRISGIVVGLLPVFLIGILFLINRDYIMLLFSAPLGRALLIISAISQLIGIILINKIIKIEM